MKAEQSTIIFRIESDLKKAFETIAAESERTVSQYLRAFIKDQIAKHAHRNATIAPESIKSATTPPDTSKTPKTQPRPKKGQKLNKITDRKKPK